MAGLIGLIVGYFAGREHLKYEMRNALQSAVRERAPPPSGGPSVAESRKPEPPPASKSNEPPPLELMLTKKGFKASNPTGGDFEDDITFELSIKNLTGKGIRAFDGVITFTDLLDNQILMSRLAINDPIQAGSTYIWDGAIKYNQFIDSQQRLRNEPKDNLKIVFDTKKILFTDGTTKEYSDR
jgi:hypothetical protein